MVDIKTATQEQLTAWIDAGRDAVLKAWEKFGREGIAPTMRARYGDLIIVVGVEFATEEDDERRSK